MTGESRIDKLIRIDVNGFAAYSPCKSPEILAARLGVPPDSIVKLDANENPYGCSPRVKSALAAYPYLNLYPDASQTVLRQELAGYTGVSPANIVAGNGSDELIDLLLRLFIERDDEVITAVPTFDMYRFSTQVCCGKPVPVLRRPDFTLDIEAVKKAITPRTRIIFIANPNNPTGTVTPVNNILELVDTGLPIVIDEAYYEFSGETVISLVSQYDNLMVLRTFSKWAGLAGLRIGYGIFPDKIAEYLHKVKPPYSINMAALAAVQESLQDITYLMNTVSKMKEERERLFDRLKGLPFLRPVPSRANFILCEVTQGQASLIQQEMEKRGILVRYYSTPLLKNYIRISVGKPEHTDIVIRVLRDIEEKING